MLVTNDEMRDHLFQLLGNDYLPKWKERHQVWRNERLALMPCYCYSWVIWNLAFLFRNKTKPMMYQWIICGNDRFDSLSRMGSQFSTCPLPTLPWFRWKASTLNCLSIIKCMWFLKSHVTKRVLFIEIFEWKHLWCKKSSWNDADTIFGSSRYFEKKSTFSLIWLGFFWFPFSRNLKMERGTFQCVMLMTSPLVVNGSV